MAKKPSLNPTRGRKGSRSTKHVGIICASFTAIQAVIWCAMAFFGLICSQTTCGSGEFITLLSTIYMKPISDDGNQTDSKSVIKHCLIVKPPLFLIILITYFLVSLAWLGSSYMLWKVYNLWNSIKDAKKFGKIWVYITAGICVLDLIVCILFFVDLICLYRGGEGYALDEERVIMDEILSDWMQNENTDDNSSRRHSTNFTDSEKIEESSSTARPHLVNPFILNDSWKPVLFPKKTKNNSELLDFSSFFEHRTPLNANQKPPGSNGVIVPAVLTVIAIRGIIVWAANLFLSKNLHRRIKLLRLKKFTFRDMFNKFSCREYLRKFNFSEYMDKEKETSKKEAGTSKESPGKKGKKPTVTSTKLKKSKNKNTALKLKKPAKKKG